MTRSMNRISVLSKAYSSTFGSIDLSKTLHQKCYIIFLNEFHIEVHGVMNRCEPRANGDESK